MVSYKLGKFEKKTERFIGFLSESKRRWIPAISKHKHFIADKEKAQKQLNLIKSAYDWQYLSHNYYYKLIIEG